MKAKTIKSNLRWKINDWIKSIEDEKLQEVAQRNVIVTGGSIVSMLLNEQVNDYDVYFRTSEAARAIAEYYVTKFKLNTSNRHKMDEGSPEPGQEIPIYVEDDEHGVRIVVKSAGIVQEGGTDEYQYFEAQPDEVGEGHVDQQFSAVKAEMEGGGSFEGQLEKADEVPATVVDDEKPKYRPVFLSANAITLSNGVQLVLRFIGEPEVIHKFYDFIHCTCYWSSWDGELVLPAAALEAIITKELRYVGSLYPLCSIIRIRKFVARGWHINAGQILKMCVQLNALDLLNIEVLKDQLTGVDAFYFMQVIDRLKEKQLEEGGDPKPVDATYLMTIIDRMF